jgi:hypothetical protein
MQLCNHQHGRAHSDPLRLPEPTQCGVLPERRPCCLSMRRASDAEGKEEVDVEIMSARSGSRRLTNAARQPCEFGVEVLCGRSRGGTTDDWTAKQPVRYVDGVMRRTAVPGTCSKNAPASARSGQGC